MGIAKLSFAAPVVIVDFDSAVGCQPHWLAPKVELVTGFFDGGENSNVLNPPGCHPQVSTFYADFQRATISNVLSIGLLQVYDIRRFAALIQTCSHWLFTDGAGLSRSTLVIFLAENSHVAAWRRITATILTEPQGLLCYSTSAQTHRKAFGQTKTALLEMDYKMTLVFAKVIFARVAGVQIEQGCPCDSYLRFSSLKVSSPVADSSDFLLFLE